MIESILIATDGSDAASAAERFGVGLAARLRARVHAVTVIEDRLLHGLRAEGLGLAAPNMEGIEAFLRARAEGVTRRLGELARQNGLECKVETLRGIADDRIVERGQSVDLVVIGRDGQDAKYRTALIGATADGVLRKTGKPALVVPAGAEVGGPLVLGFDGSPGSRIAAPRAADPLLRRLEGQGACGGALRRGAAPRGNDLGPGARGVLDPRAARREARRHRAGRPGGPDRDGSLRPQPHQRVLPGQQRRRRDPFLARRGPFGALVRA